MRSLIERIGGWFELLRLGAQTRFRRKGAYWTWREETAFGTDDSRTPNAAQRRQAIEEYARWVYRMRRARPS